MPGIAFSLAFKSSTEVDGTFTSIINEKLGPSLLACESPTLPPTSITKPVTSLTIPNRSTPTELMIKSVECVENCEEHRESAT